MTRAVREPIQVYLTPAEREELDRVAADLGVSRSEVLRRGISAVSRPPAGGGVLRDLVEEGYVTPALARTGTPPPRRPVATLAELLAELDEDRQER